MLDWKCGRESGSRERERERARDKGRNELTMSAVALALSCGAVRASLFNCRAIVQLCTRESDEKTLKLLSVNTEYDN